MQHIFKKTLLVSALSMAIAPAAYATNGLAPIGIGQAQKAMGGTGVGNPQNTMSIATNPASASFISDGYDVELELFKPDRLTTRKALPPAQGGTPSVDYDGNEKPLFFVPGGGYKRTINDKYSFGLAVYGNGGMNTEYKGGPTFISGGDPGFPPAGTVIPLSASGKNTGINLEQLFIAPTLGVKLNERHSIGLSANLVYQRFEATGIGSLAGFSSDNTNFTNNGVSSATGIGATIGWMGKFSDGFTAGASYRLKTKMGKFKKYAGLFSDQGRLDVPAALTVGFSKRVSSKTEVSADIQKIFYSDVNAIGNPATPSATNPLGGTNGPGFGWSDQTVIKLGVKHQVNPKLALMGGFNYGDSPVGPEDTFFGSLAPAVVEQHVTLGLEYKLSKKSSIIGQYRHAFSNTVKGDLIQKQPFDLTMSQDALGFSYSKQF